MEKSLARIDLNLLRALHILLEERSVTRAAQRLYVTQSAMSKTLRRLREIFADPLFVRLPEGLLPTTRALELVEPLQLMFAQVEHCLTPPEFDPATATGVLRIAAPEQFALAVVPGLLLRIREAAPNLIVESLHLMDEHLKMLAAGSLDFVINLDQPGPEGYSAQRIYSATPMAWCRRDHPLAGKNKIDLADIVAYPQISFRMQNLPANEALIISNAISAAGHELKMMLNTSHLLIALDVLVKTDALMLGPDYLSRLPILREFIVPLSIGHIPVFDRLRINLSLIQHQRTRNAPLQRWIAQEIMRTLAPAAGGQNAPGNSPLPINS